MTTVITPEWPAPPNVVAGTTTKLAPDDVLPAGLQYLKQVHGSRAVSIDAVRSSPVPVEADAVIAGRRGDCCAVRTADCLPLLLCARDGSEIAAAHGGWRGVAAGIVENTVEGLRSDPADLLAWLGPAISQDNFEVGDEVRASLLAKDPGGAEFFEANSRGRWQADLYGLVRRRLRARGVVAIYGGGWCTFRDAGLFYSYRRDTDTARMVTFIHLK